MAAICFSISVRAGASLNGRVRPPPRIARSWKSYRIVVKSTCTTSSSLINSEVSGNHWCRSRPTAASKLAPDVQPASGNAPNQARVSQASYASSALRIAAEAASRESCVGTGNPSPDFGEASRSKRGQEAPKSVRDSASSLRARNHIALGYFSPPTNPCFAALTEALATTALLRSTCPQACDFFQQRSAPIVERFDQFLQPCDFHFAIAPGCCFRQTRSRGTEIRADAIPLKRLGLRTAHRRILRANAASVGSGE
jgi:hypothetical protein